MVLLHGDLVGKDRAEEYLDEKLDFLTEWLDVTSEVYVKKEKAGELFVASVGFKLPHRTVHIETEAHSDVTTCFDELADKAKVVVSREKDKMVSKKRKQNNKLKTEIEAGLLAEQEFLMEQELEHEESKFEKEGVE